MKKILFMLFVALAFVACDKEKDKPNWNFPKFSPSAALSCLDNSGMTIVVKSDIPAEFLSTMLVLSYQENPGYEEYLYDTSTDIYDLTKLDEYTYQITVKPFIEHRKLVFYFGSQENPNARPGVVIITCGYPMDDRTKEYFEKYYSW